MFSTIYHSMLPEDVRCILSKPYLSGDLVEVIFSLGKDYWILSDKREYTLPPFWHYPHPFHSRKEANVLELKKRYSNLYIPSDVFLARPLWSDTFPAHRSFQFPRPVSFHIMNKEVEPVLENDAIYDAPDANHSFAAKVSLCTILLGDFLWRGASQLFVLCGKVLVCCVCCVWPVLSQAGHGWRQCERYAKIEVLSSWSWHVLRVDWYSFSGGCFLSSTLYEVIILSA